MKNDATTKSGKQFTFTLSWKLLSLVLMILLVGLVIYTRVWEGRNTATRTISIKGDASIKRAPDSFVFNPTFEAENQQAINDLTKKVVGEVKALGLGDAGIQTQVSNYENFKDGIEPTVVTYSVYMTLSVEDKELAQKIQDYLASSGAKGTISPTTGFTKETKKQLVDEATAIAVEDAKKRAESTAGNVGAKLGKVIKVDTADDDSRIEYALAYDSMMVAGETLPINAGETEFNYSVNVEFEIR